MKVRDIITSNFFHGDIDVCDDYDERAWIAYCGTQLTEEGFKEFEVALDRPCYYNVPSNTLIIECDDGKQAQAVKDLFYSMSGYCTESQYETWFHSWFDDVDNILGRDFKEG